MKTRVIQDEPDEPTTTSHRVDPEHSQPGRISLRAWRAGAPTIERRRSSVGSRSLCCSSPSASSRRMKKIVFETSGPGESGRADTILYEDFKQPAGESVLIQSRSLTADDPEFKAAVHGRSSTGSRRSTRSRRSSRPTTRTTAARSPLTSTRCSSRSRSAGRSEEAVDKVDPIVARVAEVQKAHPAFYVGSFGESTKKEIVGAFNDDLKKAGLYSIPLTLAILLLAFGALVAAGIPLLLGLTAVLATFGLVALISQVLPMDDSVPAIILLVGLAVGVDYTMFYLKREREERAAGRSEEAALEAAAATSGRSVLISGCTVLVAMAGMFLTGDASFASFAVATMTVVAVAMLGSLTVLPALLSKLGDGVDRGARAVRPPAPPQRRRGPDLGSNHRPRAPAPGRSRPRWPAGSSSPSRSRRTSCTRPRPASTAIRRSS